MRFAFVPLRMIPAPVVCVMVESALLLMLERNEKARAMAEALDGLCLRVHVEDAHLGLDLWVEGMRVYVRPAGARSPQARVRGNAKSFARVLLGEDVDALVMRRKLVVEGDGEAMARFQRWLQAMQLDWERALKDAFGEAFGARVAGAIRSLARFAEASEQRTKKALKDALAASGGASHHELARLRAGTEDLLHELAHLRTRIEDLQARRDAQG